MQPSFALALSRVDWTVFASVTFRDEPSERRAMLAAAKLLKWCAWIEGAKFGSYQYCIRIETGERTGRRHLHLLIAVERGNLGKFVVAPGRASLAYKFCKQNFGLSRWRAVLGGSDSAVAYMTKDMDAGADIYELAKTARTQGLIISHTAERCIRRRIGLLTTKRPGDKHTGASQGVVTGHR